MPELQKASKSTIYFISGLGADWRMFQLLKLPEDQPYEHIHWLEPFNQDEPIQAYAQRIRDQIKDSNPILIGLSFGGVVAIELSKMMAVKMVILISSLDTHHGLPKLYRLLGSMHLHKFTPFWLIRSLHPLGPWFFGARTPFEKKLLKEVILSTDEKYLRWSLGQLFTWRQRELIPDLVHLHGTKDRVLPLKDRPGLIKIKGGEHLMVLHQADQISSILRKILEENNDR